MHLAESKRLNKIFLIWVFIVWKTSWQWLLLEIFFSSSTTLLHEEGLFFRKMITFGTTTLEHGGDSRSLDLAKLTRNSWNSHETQRNSQKLLWTTEKLYLFYYSKKNTPEHINMILQTFPIDYKSLTKRFTQPKQL